MLLLTTLFCAIAAAEDHVIKQEDREFSTNTITIKAGDKLIFTGQPLYDQSAEAGGFDGGGIHE